MGGILQESCVVLDTLSLFIFLVNVELFSDSCWPLYDDDDHVASRNHFDYFTNKLMSLANAKRPLSHRLLR